jgi:hypothetical protein
MGFVVFMAKNITPSQFARIYCNSEGLSISSLKLIKKSLMLLISCHLVSLAELNESRVS